MLTRWFVFSIVVISIFGLLSNTSQTGLSKIDIQFLKLSCPLPINGATANINFTDNTIVVYNITNDSSTSDYHVTTFQCFDANEGLPLLSAPQVSRVIYTTANNWFNIGTGYLFYISQIISDMVQKVIAMFTLISFILTPINFNILGFTISDIGGQALMVVIGLYIFCYIGIAIFLYKALLPTGGSV